jgi:hypothetical protein
MISGVVILLSPCVDPRFFNRFSAMTIPRFNKSLDGLMKAVKSSFQSYDAYRFDLTVPSQLQDEIPHVYITDSDVVPQPQLVDPGSRRT